MASILFLASQLCRLEERLFLNFSAYIQLDSREILFLCVWNHKNIKNIIIIGSKFQNSTLNSFKFVRLVFVC